MGILTSLEKLLRLPPVGDPKEAFRATTVRAVALVILGGAVAWAITGIFLTENPEVRRAVTAVTLAAPIVALVLLRSGRIGAAGAVVSITLWITVTAGIVWSGDIFERGENAYFVVIVTTALVVGGRAAVLMAALCAAVETGVVVTVGPVEERVLGKLASDAVLLLAVGALLAYARSRIEWALAAAEEKESELLDSSRELESSRERFRVLTESSPDMIAETDMQMRFLYASPNYEREFGWKPEELIGRSALDFIHPDDRYSMNLNPQSEDDPIYENVYRGQHRDGSWRWFESSGRRFRAADGSIHSVAVTRDVTERRDLEQRLRQSQKLEAVGRLAGGIAHDFNNLITVIQGYAEVLLDDEGVRASYGEEVEQIAEASQRAEGLTRQLLAFSRRQLLHPEVVDVNESLRGMEALLRRLLGEHVELSTDVYREPLCVLVDASQFEQIIVNLAVNARDAMPAGGKLRIETGVEPLGANAGGFQESAVLTVVDEGTGIDPDTLSRIFDPFFTTKPPGRGTGLGLSTVHGIVEQSGGQIEVSSTVGRGTTFRIRLPRVEGTRREEIPPRKTALPIERRAATVLLAEDDSSLRRLIEAKLVRAGYHVLVAEDGVDALEVAARADCEIDVLLADVIMPRMGGTQLKERLEARHPDIRVLFMSGYTEHPSSGVVSLEPGDSLLEKPFSLAELIDRLAELLEEDSGTRRVGAGA